MYEQGQIPLAEELLAVMRVAARNTLAARERFITPRALLLALLDDPSVGPVLAPVVDRDRLEAIEPSEIDLSGVSRMPDERIGNEEQAALVRYDTIAFKTPDGRDTVWLNRDSLSIFLEGSRRVEDRYNPKQLALGLAAEAVRQPGVLSTIRVEPGALIDAIYKL
ncbi:MAG TPA: hypothetical protein VIG32_05975 [Candidatus Baltobacteraceae bacterium]